MSTSVLNIRTDTDVKHEAENIYKRLGMNMSTAVNIFLRQSIRKNGIPFDVTLDEPSDELVRAMAETEELIKDKNAKQYKSFQEIRNELGV